MKKRKEYPDPGNVITIDGFGKTTPEQSAMQLQTFVTQMSMKAPKIARKSKCLHEYRRALNAAVGVHIASVLGESSDRLKDELLEYMNDLDSCLRE